MYLLDIIIQLPNYNGIDLWFACINIVGIVCVSGKKISSAFAEVNKYKLFVLFVHICRESISRGQNTKNHAVSFNVLPMAS